MTDYRVTPYPDGKWYIEKHASYSYIRSFFGKHEDIWQWYKASEGFDILEDAMKRIKFVEDSYPVYVTIKDKPSNNRVSELMAEATEAMKDLPWKE